MFRNPCWLLLALASTALPSPPAGAMSLEECAREVERRGYAIEAMRVSEDGSHYQFEASWQGFPWWFNKTRDCKIY